METDALQAHRELIADDTSGGPSDDSRLTSMLPKEEVDQSESDGHSEGDEACPEEACHTNDNNNTLSIPETLEPEPIVLVEHGQAIEEVPQKTTLVSTTHNASPANAAVECTSTPSSSGSSDILGLPHDSLHSVASFLTPTEFCQFGLASKGSHRLCRAIARSIRMHGFKCAQEIITAWKAGQHEDAKELAALYVSSGVPVYPYSLGHSYHTIVWRMSLEASEMGAMSANEDTRDDGAFPSGAVEVPQDQSPSPKVDPFYSERLEFRAREGYSPDVTYVEEKGLFWLDKNGTNLTDSNMGQALALGGVRRPTSTPIELRPTPSSAEGITLSVSPGTKSPPESSNVKKLSVPIHQHLFDQHIRGLFSVDDQDGAMVTPTVSLSADFYHPATSPSVDQGPSNDRRWSFERINDVEAIQAEPVHIQTIPVALTEIEGGPIELRPDAGSVTPQVLTHDNLAMTLGAVGENEDDMLFEPPQAIPAFRIQSVREHVNYSIYSSASNNPIGTDGSDPMKELRRHLRSRFATYERRLDSFLAQGDNTGFDECILDFWDEFFPHSSMIHYYDRNTVVPRISHMEKFLTRPCPKALGIVQCEIERIKLSSKGRGVSMKGRLFPTYEYRLFIRNRPHTPSPESASPDGDRFMRKDTVLMVGKNRGRKYAEASGVIPISAASKKGSNNYYLYMPDQTDVDAHYNYVNEPENPAKVIPNGASYDPVLTSKDSTSVPLGRLQSNFIGTEFQIFTARARKRPRYKVPQRPTSDDELDYDSQSSENTARRTTRFGRLSLRRSNHGSESYATESGASDTSSRTGRRQPVVRTTSCPEIPSPRVSSGRHSKPRGRAIANSPEATDAETTLFEEEDGAITYTANLLGSRPRIMDVCIPKVRADGVAGAEWRKYLESCDDTDECRMLSCFRQLLHRIDAHDTNNPLDGGHNDVDSDVGENEGTEDFGLVALQNRPPWWNVELGSFVLNFGGRVSVASVKNFQLCDRNDQDRIMLQFGRIQGRHSFTMDYQHPLTAVQAFSIAISSLQSKISFG